MVLLNMPEVIGSTRQRSQAGRRSLGPSLALVHQSLRRNKTKALQRTTAVPFKLPLLF